MLSSFGWKILTFMNTLIHKETKKGNQDFLNGRFFLILFKQERKRKSNP